MAVNGPILFVDHGASIELTVKNVGDDAVSVSARQSLGSVLLDSSIDLDDSAEV